MSKDQLTYLWTATGTQTLSLGFQPKRVRFTCSQKDSGSNDTIAHKSDGTVTNGSSGTWSECESFYTDTTGSQSFRFDDRLVSHYERVGGTITEIFRINFNSWTTNGMKVDIAVLSGSNYVVNLEYET